MQELTREIDFLFSAALHKCENKEDAQDLTQETLLSALLYTAKGNKIDDLRGWLLTVMNRKFYDMLRKKYKQPLVSIGENFDIFDIIDIIDESVFCEDINVSDEAEKIRREIAFLTSLYREVTVRFYMNGQSVQLIAQVLGIPEGTVKSRLSTARNQIKKGFENMESYTENSYQPIKLHISNSGNASIYDEPRSLVENDLIAQNLLFLAYEQPITETDLSKAIGVPMAYIEPIICKLVNGELMKRIGNKVYTDFIIYTNDDQERTIPDQLEFIKTNFDLIWKPFETLYANLREEYFYSKLTENQRNALEMFCFFRVFDFGSFRAFSNSFKSEQRIPDRPNGGRWIAFGNANTWLNKNIIQEHHKYSYAGQRNTVINDYLGAKQIKLHVFDPEGFPNRIYYRDNIGKAGIFDDNLIKLLYIIESGIDFEKSGLDEKWLKSIPWLTECKILTYDENNRLKVDIPILNKDTIKILDKLLDDAQLETTKNLEKPLFEFLSNKKKQIPKHLTSVPLQKQFFPSMNAMLFAALRQAIAKGYIHNGGYDNEIQCPYPMILVKE